jgi:carbamoyl-phosphate synthase small subunit
MLAEAPLRTDYMVEAGTRSVLEFPAAVSGGSCVDLYNEPFVCQAPPPPNCRVAVLDFGIKRNIIAAMQRRGMDVWLFPYGSSAEEILAVKPDGLFLSNGPGDPESAVHGVDIARQLLGKLPIFGICMGHQVLALACGAETYKLKYGHRGGNHGVCDLDTGRSAITSQNHSFAVKADNLEKKGLIVTHVNLNDGTIEGLRHKTLPMFSVQYHPEGSPGPNDSDSLFDRFIELIKRF